MSLALILQGLGSVGVFASRAFVPAFVTALMIRLGPQSPWLAGSGLLPHIRNLPPWFTSDAALVVLGILAAMELAAERSPEARSVLDEIDGYLKAGMAAFTYLGVLNATERTAVGKLINEAATIDSLPVVAVAAGTFFAAQIRSGLIGPISEVDADDDLGIQRLLRWAGDLWGTLGTAVLIVFPLVTIVAYGVTALILFLIERQVESRADKAKIACARCGQMIHPSALTCASCKAPVEQPREISLLGMPGKNPADVASLPYRLVALKRCPICANRFKRRAVDQDCGACGHRLMADPDFATGYIASVDRKVPMVCGACFVLGLIPVLGVIPGVICYRLTIVAPFRRYIPPGRGFLLRWAIRLVVLLLVSVQWLPVAGAFALPAMALINYAAYRWAFRRLASRALGRKGPSPDPP